MIQNFQRKDSEEELEEKESPHTKEKENKDFEEETKSFALEEKSPKIIIIWFF